MGFFLRQSLGRMRRQISWRNFGWCTLQMGMLKAEAGYDLRVVFSEKTAELWVKEIECRNREFAMNQTAGLRIQFQGYSYNQERHWERGEQTRVPCRLQSASASSFPVTWEERTWHLLTSSDPADWKLWLLYCTPNYSLKNAFSATVKGRRLPRFLMDIPKDLVIWTDWNKIIYWVNVGKQRGILS